jgi:glycosyltransferase involved in cell wall biosynthesis
LAFNTFKLEIEYLYTVITSTYNCELDFIITAESIVSQNRNDIQWIVIDGKSKSSTISIINEYKEFIHTFVSEPDEGIYDAWNKAVNYIKGQWVIFLGAGDTFHAPDTLNLMEPVIKNGFPEYTIIYGKLNLYSPYSNLIIKNIGCDLSLHQSRRSFRPNVPIHPEVFQHKSLFNSTPVFDISYHIVGDTDFLSRVFDLKRSKFINTTITNIRGGGVSQNLKFSLKIFNELNRINIKNKLELGVYYKYKSYLYLLSKYLLSFLISDKIFWRFRSFLVK